MDPDEALTELRRRVAKVITEGDRLDDGFDELDRIAELFDGLDQWLARGGHLPRPWSRG